MPKSKSREEDKLQDERGQSRVDKTHGGKVVESISPDKLESFNDDKCKHERLVRDASETDFNAFECANPLCNEVVLYNKSS